MRRRRNILVEKNANIQQVLAQSVLNWMIKQGFLIKHITS